MKALKVSMSAYCAGTTDTSGCDVPYVFNSFIRMGLLKRKQSNRLFVVYNYCLAD